MEDSPRPPTVVSFAHQHGVYGGAHLRPILIVADLPQGNLWRMLAPECPIRFGGRYHHHTDGNGLPVRVGTDERWHVWSGLVSMIAQGPERMIGLERNAGEIRVGPYFRPLPLGTDQNRIGLAVGSSISELACRILSPGPANRRFSTPDSVHSRPFGPSWFPCRIATEQGCTTATDRLAVPTPRPKVSVLFQSHRRVDARGHAHPICVGTHAVGNCGEGWLG